MRRVMEIATPLGDGVLLFYSMTVREELGRLSEFHLTLLSERGDIKLDDILAKSVTVKLELPEDHTRYFSCYITRFAQMGTHGRYYQYHATAHPWLWFLTRTANCRIFQDMTVPDIIKKIFDDHTSIADFKLDLTGSYRTREYCVQYRETDFNFVSRLLEEEGIYYYFKHNEGQHTLVLVDSGSAHTPFDGYAEIPYIPHDRTLHQEYERIGEWYFAREVQAGRYVIDDFDFTKPSVELQVKTKLKRGNDLSDYEIYDYPGEYDTASDGDHYVSTRLEEVQTQFEVATGNSNARGLSCGHLFKLTGFEREDQNREYLVKSTELNLQLNEYETAEGGGAHYHCAFTAMDSTQAFRTERLTRKPKVAGPQTAIVVGPDGDEIYTDKYGRVKAQFHWDREGEHNENSSCWIRVSHPWAGNHWGMIAIPRIGQEVIVNFLEGDPDAPIITGRVYNAEQMPPYDLPANMTQTGIKTRSSKGGSGANFNEIRFEDKKGSEEIYIHAQKDHTVEIEHDQKIVVKRNRSETGGKNATISVGVDRKQSVGSNEEVSVGANHKHTVGADHTVSIGANHNHTVGADHTVSIGSNHNVSVGASQTHSIGSSRTTSVGAADNLSVATLTIKASGAINISGASIVLKAGGSSIAISPGGINVDSSGPVSIKGAVVKVQS